jgi:hypothetical protein
LSSRINDLLSQAARLSLPLFISLFLISFLERAARLIRASRINGRVTLFYVAYDPVFVYDESRAASYESFFVKDAVSSNHLPLDVGEKREGYTYVFLEALVCGIAINTNAQNLCVALLKVGEISLIRLQLLRSTASKSQHIKG